MFFLWFWGRPGRSMGWAHMQSAHACAVETHFFVFAFFLKNRLHMTSFWLHFGTVFCQQSQFWVKKELQKMVQKKVTPPSQTAGYEHARRLPEAGTLSRIVRARNNCSNTCWSNCSSFCLKMWIRLKIEFEKKGHDLTHPGQGPGDFFRKCRFFLDLREFPGS